MMTQIRTIEDIIEVLNASPEIRTRFLRHSAYPRCLNSTGGWMPETTQQGMLETQRMLETFSGGYSTRSRNTAKVAGASSGVRSKVFQHRVAKIGSDTWLRWKNVSQELRRSCRTWRRRQTSPGWKPTGFLLADLKNDLTWRLIGIVAIASSIIIGVIKLWN